MELTLGPVLFEWKREELLSFYNEVAGMDVDRVYVGEVVCTKKLSLTREETPGIIKMLEASGKKVTLSSLAIVSNDEELDFTRSIVDMHSSIEANDMSVLNIADMSAKEVFAGPHITSYNAPSIDFLKEAGVKRVVFPVELPRASMAYSMKHSTLPAEVFVHGKAPLAFSWRCYASRAHGLTKTECKHHCAKYPDGLDIKSMDAEPIFSINGTSILSAPVYTLIEHVHELKADGAAALRISPQKNGTAKVVEIFRSRMNGSIGGSEALAMLRETLPRGAGVCNGWYHGKAGKDYLAALDNIAQSKP